MVALADKAPVKVIGETGIIRDRPGFEVDLITREVGDGGDAPPRPPLGPDAGHAATGGSSGTAARPSLAPGDTMSVPEDLAHGAVPSMTGDAALYHIVATGDPAGPTWKP